MDYKKPLSIDKQIEYLKKNKEVVFNDITNDKAKDVLLTSNYINVISPFKYIFAKKDNNQIPIKIDNKHVYPRKVDFAEYNDAYIKERSQYNALFAKISSFEKTFNSIISNVALTEYSIENSDKFMSFINRLCESAEDSIEYSGIEKTHMIEEVRRFDEKINKYNSPYIFFDRLTLSETITIYRLLEYKKKKETFNMLKKYNCTIGYPNMEQFDEALTRLVQIRNCVYHNNSLTILLRYYKIKNKELRASTDKKKFKTLIKHLINSKIY